MTARMSTHRYGRLASAAAVTIALTASSIAQTKVTAPPNKYSIQDDVKLGQEASAEVRKQLPMLNDGRTEEYVEDVGRVLVNAIPAEFQHREFRYSFGIVNQKEINAFALPGGPMYLHRGMIESAKTEGEMAGVMAHEISHVALRHGTAGAGKSQTPAILGTIGQIAGAILGGAAGQILSTGAQVGAGLKMAQYSRDFERQADILGAQILARAGYDPREMANMFKTIQAQGGRGGPEWMSTHPDPGNRYNAIINESKNLSVQGNANTGDFQTVRARLGDMSPAPTAEQVARGQGQGQGGGQGGGTRPTSTGRRTVQVEPPSASYRTEQPVDFLRVSVPSNWAEVDSAGGVTYAPEGGFFRADNGATSFTHGVQIGTGPGGGNLQRDTDALLQGFLRSNPELRQESRPARDNIAGRNGLTTLLSNVSEVTGEQERVALSTVHLPDGSLLYLIGVAPRNEAQTYDSTFRRVRQSVQIAQRR